MANVAAANQAATAAEPVLLESKAGRIATLTMNRPDRLNALTPEMMGLLYDALVKYDSDPTVGAIVITGAGRGFCAGGDVKNMNSGPPPVRQDRMEHLKRAHRIPLAIKKSSKVVIAQVNGPATGAGLSIALACDLRISARSARFGAVFAQVGLAGDFGISHSLTQAVGPAMARQMLLSAEIIDANRALEIGMINYLVDDAALAEETRKLAQRYAEGPTLAFSLIKQNLLDAETSTFAQSLDFEADTQTTVLMSADHKEAVSAFLEKRKGSFKGK